MNPSPLHFSLLHRIIAPLGMIGIALAPTPSSGQVINEFVGNHTGPDDFVYLEVAGAPLTDYSNLTLVQVAGDVGDDAGVVESAGPVGTTDAAGIWWSGFLPDAFDNESYSLFLVEGWSGTVGVDLDPGDDGTLDSTPWTAIVDSVAVRDSDTGDPSYGAETVLVAGFDGDGFPPGGASRIPNAVDTDSVGDWRRNDWDGAGLPGHTGHVGANEAANTPGTENGTALAPDQPPLLHELVFDHVGFDDHEFVEVWGDSSADYSTFRLVTLDETGTVATVQSLGTTGAEGFWTTGFLTDTYPDDTLTLFLVEDWTGSPGLDLDSDDDGTLDVTPWSALHDSISVRYSPAELTYSAVVLDPDFDGGGSPVGGASRFPAFLDSDSATDWIRNDFDGAGFDGFPGSLEIGEAENSIGFVNVPHVATYYHEVDASAPAELRESLHAAIDDHLRFPYSASSLDTWDVLELADEDPNDPNRILTVYRNSSLAKFGGGSGPYNREHSWPKTFGFPDEDGVSSAHTDCHHLMLSDVGYNGARGSRAFGTCDAGCSELPTDANNGHGGAGGGYPGDSNWQGVADGGGGTWEAWGHRRGDVARAQLYMDVRYEGGLHTVTGVAEPDLILTDDTSLIVGTGTNTTGEAYMGRLSVLLAWHLEDPPDDEERRRNEVVYRFQGNRNPFVDHPEWVGCLFLGECGLFLDGFESGDTQAWSSVAP